MPSPPPAPPQQQTCCALPWPYPQPTESLASRRERIATAVLSGIAAQLDANGCALQSVSDADVKYSVRVADMLIEELDKDGER